MAAVLYITAACFVFVHRSCLSPSCGCIFFCVTALCAFFATFGHWFGAHFNNTSHHKIVNNLSTTRTHLLMAFFALLYDIRLCIATMPTHHSITWFLLILTVTSQLFSCVLMENVPMRTHHSNLEFYSIEIVVV